MKSLQEKTRLKSCKTQLKPPLASNHALYFCGYICQFVHMAFQRSIKMAGHFGVFKGIIFSRF